MKNFIIAFALVALAVVSCAALNTSRVLIDEEMSQFSIFKGDDDEVAGLGEDKKIFRDYCIRARDDVKKFLSNSANSKVAKMFNFVAKTFANAMNEVGRSGKKAADEGEALIKNDFMRITSVMSSIYDTVKTVLNIQMRENYHDIKGELNGETLVDAVKSSCILLNNVLKPELEASLKAAKREFKALDSGKYSKAMDQIRLKNLGCVTTNRVSTISRGCDIFTALLPAVQNFY